VNPFNNNNIVVIDKSTLFTNDRIFDNSTSNKTNTYVVPNNNSFRNYTGIVKDNVHNITYIYTNVSILP
jgi:hypothetical protein